MLCHESPEIPLTVAGLVRTVRTIFTQNWVDSDNSLKLSYSRCLSQYLSVSSIHFLTHKLSKFDNFEHVFFRHVVLSNPRSKTDKRLAIFALITALSPSLFNGTPFVCQSSSDPVSNVVFNVPDPLQQYSASESTTPLPDSASQHRFIKRLKG